MPRVRFSRSDGLSGLFWLGAFLVIAVWTFWRLGGFDLWTTITTADGATIRFPNTFATVDHPFHATRAEILRRSLADGHLLRWIGSHQGGYPVEFYPLGAAWMEVIVWAVTLGFWPVMVVHKLVVIGVFLLPVAGFAALARYGKLPWSVPVLAIAMHLSVRGWWWSGGYMELLEWGLLTNVASAALLPLVLALQRGYLRNGHGWQLAAGSVVASIALYTNVRSVLPLVAILAGCGFAAIIEWRCRECAGSVARRSAAMVGLTVLLAAPLVGALARFSDLYVFVRYSTYADLGDYWQSSLQAVSAPVMALAAVGAAMAFLAGKDDGARTVLIVLGLYIAGTSLTVVSDAAAQLVSQLEATRLMPFQRLLVIYLAAYGVWSVADRCLNWIGHPEPSQGFPAAAVLGETSAAVDDGETLHFVQNEGEAGRGNDGGAGSGNVAGTGGRNDSGTGVLVDAIMAVSVLLFLGGYIGGWLPGIPDSDRATGPIVTTGTAAIAGLQDQIELADQAAEPGTAILVLGGVVSWHDQLWAPQWSDRRFFYDDWLWYWQTDHYGDYDPLTSHAYDDDSSAVDASYFTQHGIGAVVVTGQAAESAAGSPLLQLVRAGQWSTYLVRNPIPIVSVDDDPARDVAATDRRITGAADDPSNEFAIRHNWYPRWSATVDGSPANIERDDRGYMIVTADEPGRDVVVTYGTDAWDWIARAALFLGLAVAAGLVLPVRRFGINSAPSQELARR